MPLNAKCKTRCVGYSDRLDRAVFRYALNDDPFSRLENTLTVKGVYADGFPAQDPREGAAWNEADIMTVGEDNSEIGMNFPGLQPRHPMVHAAGQFANLGMQRSAEGDIHFLKAAANTEDRHASGDADLDQCKGKGVTAFVVRFMLWMQLGVETGGMHICTSAREQHAVDDLEQFANIGDSRRARKHHRQRAGDIRHRTKVPFTDKLHRKSIVDDMRVPDHADYRSLHCLAVICPLEFLRAICDPLRSMAAASYTEAARPEPGADLP